MSDEALRAQQDAHGRISLDSPETVPTVGPVLAVDLGGTYLRTAVVEPDGRVVGRQQRRTPIEAGSSTVIEVMVASLRESLDTYRMAERRARSADATAPTVLPEPVAVGISAPGPVDPWHGVLIDPPNLGRSFWDLGLADRIGRSMELPVYLDRDTHLAALAEGMYGAARDVDDYLYLTVSTGVGGAVVTGGRLMTGPDGVAGELGHLTVDLDGPRCGCGAQGHLEALSSGSGIARIARADLAAGEASEALVRLAEQIAPRAIEAVDVSAVADAGDAYSARLMEQGRRAFAAAMVSLVDIFNPSRVIVGGGLAMAHGDRLLDPAREAVRRTGFRVAARRAEIVLAGLGDDVCLVGAHPLVRLRQQERRVVTSDRTTDARSVLTH